MSFLPFLFFRSSFHCLPVFPFFLPFPALAPFLVSFLVSFLISFLSLFLPFSLPSFLLPCLCIYRRPAEGIPSLSGQIGATAAATK
jgi:hypothetical protein